MTSARRNAARRQRQMKFLVRTVPWDVVKTRCGRQIAEHAARQFVRGICRRIASEGAADLFHCAIGTWTTPRVKTWHIPDWQDGAP